MMRTSFGRRRARAGTSLVEVMIAIAILAILLLVFLSAMTSASSTSAVSKENVVALAVLESSMENVLSNNFQSLWNTYMVTASPYYTGTGTPPKIFQDILNDSAITSQIGNLSAVATLVQNGTALTPAQTASWNNFVTQFKNHPYALPPTNRLSNETINLYMYPSSDIYQGGTFNISLNSTSHAYVDFMVEILWTDATGKNRHEDLISRRSQ